MTNRFCVLIFLLVLVLAALAPAQTFTTLYNFTGGLDGNKPYAGVIQDQSGNLYGTTWWGGSDARGVVFKLDTTGNETVLHSFPGYPDGNGPLASLVRDKAGNIYGTTFTGGAHHNGAVFKIDAAGNETVLYSFTGRSDGCLPSQGLITGESGTLLGTTQGCGAHKAGTIFKVDRAGKFTVLHPFVGAPSDGAYPLGGHLAMDRSGNIYGVTQGGGAYDYGALYELSKNGTLTLLHSFDNVTSDGCNPLGSVTRDSYGNLYGTTTSCGSNGGGVIWRVSKAGTETILHNFGGHSSDGCQPEAGVTRDSKGNLYGVTYSCGANDSGALYELSANGKLALLHSFDDSDGSAPIGEVLRTTNGTLLGTTEYGGTGGCGRGPCGGTVWKYVP